MTLLDFSQGAAWFSTTAFPSGGPTAAQRIANISDISIQISKDTTERGPYIGDDKIITGQRKVSGSFTIDLTRVANAVHDAILAQANTAGTGTAYLRIRTGPATATESAMILDFTGVLITSATISNDDNIAQMEVEFEASNVTITPSTLT